MRVKLVAFTSLSVAILAFTVPIRATQRSGSLNLNDVSMEIAALETLHDLDLTTTQLTALSKLAKESAPKSQRREPANASEAVSKALANLHAALSREDDAQISDCRQKLDAIMQKEEPELDNNIIITDTARQKASDALALLTVPQVGTFIASLELTDPVELLLDGVEQVRTLKDKELEAEIATLADEVTWLLGGADADESSDTRDKVTAFLQRAKDIKTDSDLAKQKKSLEKDAKELVGDVGNLDVITHIAEKGMAELLANPRLEAAIRIQTRLSSSSRRQAPTKSKSPSGRSAK
jgi:hypothetical protein